MPLGQSPDARRLWGLACLSAFFEICAGLPLKMAIDDPRFKAHFAGNATVTLDEATAFAGPGWNLYPWLDIQVSFPALG